MPRLEPKPKVITGVRPKPPPSRPRPPPLDAKEAQEEKLPSAPPTPPPRPSRKVPAVAAAKAEAKAKQEQEELAAKSQIEPHDDADFTAPDDDDAAGHPQKYMRGQEEKQGEGSDDDGSFLQDAEIVVESSDSEAERDEAAEIMAAMQRQVDAEQAREEERARAAGEKMSHSRMELMLLCQNLMQNVLTKDTTDPATATEAAALAKRAATSLTEQAATHQAGEAAGQAATSLAGESEEEEAPELLVPQARAYMASKGYDSWDEIKGGKTLVHLCCEDSSSRIVSGVICWWCFIQVVCHASVSLVVILAIFSFTGVEVCVA